MGSILVRYWFYIGSTMFIFRPHLHLLFQMLQLPVVDVDLSIGLTCNQAAGDYATKVALKNHAKGMMKR